MRSIASTKQLDMDLRRAQQLALELMEQHNLMERGWRFGFDTAKRRFGCCNYSYKEITLSRALVLVNDEDRVKNTTVPESKYIAVCNTCGHIHRKHRATTRTTACGICCKGKFQSEYILHFKVNPKY